MIKNNISTAWKNYLTTYFGTYVYYIMYIFKLVYCKLMDEIGHLEKDGHCEREKYMKISFSAYSVFLHALLNYNTLEKHLQNMWNFFPSTT
jgi:hypothetical protein